MLFIQQVLGGLHVQGYTLCRDGSSSNQDRCVSCGVWTLVREKDVNRDLQTFHMLEGQPPWVWKQVVVSFSWPGHSKKGSQKDCAEISGSSRRLLGRRKERSQFGLGSWSEAELFSGHWEYRVQAAGASV